jgi:glycosyltransferase involved in cell wall biosynthesis
MNKLLFISHSSAFSGGSEDDLERLLNYFSKYSEYQLHLIAPEGPKLETLSKFIKSYCRIRLNLINPLDNRFWIIFKYIIKCFIQYLNSRNFIKSLNPDLIFWNSSILVGFFIFLRKKNNIFFVREKYDNKFIYFLIKKIIPKYSEHIFTVNDILKKKLQSVNNKHKIDTLYSSAENILIDDIKININESSFNLLNIGGVTSIKSQITIIEAMYLLNKINVIVFLNILASGKDDNYFSKLCNTINHYNLDEKVNILYHQPKNVVYNYIKKSDCIIIASMSEGFPVVISETFMYGKPLISTNVGGIQEIIKNDYNGILFNPGNVEELKNAIIKIKNDKNYRDNISNNAKKTFSDVFNLDGNMKTVQKVVNYVLNKNIIKGNE